LIFIFLKRVIVVFFISTNVIFCNELSIYKTKVYDLSNMEYKLYLENKITKEELYIKKYKDKTLLASRYLVKLLKEYKKMFLVNSDDKINSIKYHNRIQEELFNNIVLFDKDLDIKSIKELIFSISNQDISTNEAIFEIDLLIKDIKDMNN
jgi:hypothetical protein